MGVAGADTLLRLIKQKQDLQSYRERHWNGTVQDYMEIVMASPRVARNACQRLYDMILAYGFTEYTRHHERYVHYRLFDDPIDHGRDAVFGLDASLMRLVHNIKSAAFGYGTEKRILLLHGPVGSSKSTIARLLKKGLEIYSNTAEGALYTYGWRSDLGASGPDAVHWCPMHEDPLHLIPLESQEAVYAELNRRMGPKDYRIVHTGALCPFCRKTYQDFMTAYDGDWEKVIRHVVVKRLVLRLEGADADPVLLGEDEPLDDDVPDHLLPVAVVGGHEVLVRLPAERAQRPGVDDAVVLGPHPPVQLGVDGLLALERDEVQRVLVHRAPVHGIGSAGAEVGPPPVGVESAFGGVRVDLQALLEQSGDRRLGRADRAVQEQDALLGPVAEGGRLDVVDEPHQGSVEAEDRVSAVVDGVVEEPVVDVALVMPGVLGEPVGEDHVVEPLAGVARHPRARHDDLHVVLDRPVPVPFPVALEVLLLFDEAEQRVRSGDAHGFSPSPGV